MSTSVRLVSVKPENFIEGQVYSYDTPYGMHYEGTFSKFEDKNGRTYSILGPHTYSNNRSNGTRSEATSTNARAKHELGDIRNAKMLMTSSRLPPHPKRNMPSLKNLSKMKLSTKQLEDLKSDDLVMDDKPGRMFSSTGNRALGRKKTHRKSHKRHRTVKRSTKNKK